MKRTKEEAAQTREEIFRAGIKVFAGKGYAAARLSDVAREAGVSRGAIYWHFENKRAFFQETVARLNGIYDSLVEATLDTTGTPTDLVETAITRIIERFVEDEEFRAMQELVIRTAMSHTSPVTAENRPIGRGDETAMHLLQQAIERHELHHDWSAPMALHALEAFVAGVFLMILDRQLNPTQEEIRQLAAFVRRGFTPADKGETR
ncbi:MAG: TetR family transcriptional regulator [Alkalispirochaeta sp.]